MQRPVTMAGCLVLTGALLVGCGSSSKKSSSASTPATTPPATTPAATTPAATPAAGGVISVQMKNIAFKPDHITAKVGQTIKWTNEDSVDHNVTATKGEEFKSKNFGMGGTYSYKLDKPGTITYMCTIHPNMKATATVTK